MLAPCGRLQVLLFRRAMTRITKETKSFRWHKAKVTGDLEDYSHAELLYHAANMVGGRIYMLGSRIPWLFYLDIKKWRWVKLRTGKVDLNENASVLVDDRIMGVIGGKDPSEGLLTLDLNLDESTVRSLDFPTDAIPGRSISEYIDFARMMVVFGGYAGGAKDTLVQIDVDTLKTFEPKPSGSPSPPRNGHASCCLVTGKAATVFIYGGRNEHGYLSDLYLLHFEQNRFRWSQGTINSIAEPRCSASINWIEGRLFVYGGFKSGFDDTRDLYILDLDDNKWHSVRRARKRYPNGKDVEYRIHGTPEESSTHLAFSCNEGLLVLAGFGRRYPWLSILSGES